MDSFKQMVLNELHSWTNKRSRSERRSGEIVPNKGPAGSDRRKSFKPGQVPAIQRMAGKPDRRK